jgi:hypothetical protein
LLDQPAYFGQFGCDPPELLVRRMFERLIFENPNGIDVILLTGDFVGHLLPLERAPLKSPE